MITIYIHNRGNNYTTTRGQWFGYIARKTGDVPFVGTNQRQGELCEFNFAGQQGRHRGIAVTFDSPGDANISPAGEIGHIFGESKYAVTLDYVRDYLKVLAWRMPR